MFEQTRQYGWRHRQAQGAHRADSARLRAGLSYCRVITEREVLTCAVIPYRPVVGAVEAIYREGRVVGALLTSGARSQGRSCYQTCHGPHEGGVPHRQRSPLPCLWGPGLSVSLTRSPNSPATALWGGPRVHCALASQPPFPRPATAAHASPPRHRSRQPTPPSDQQTSETDQQARQRRNQNCRGVPTTYESMSTGSTVPGTGSSLARS